MFDAPCLKAREGGSLKFIIPCEFRPEWSFLQVQEIYDYDGKVPNRGQFMFLYTSQSTSSFSSPLNLRIYSKSRKLLRNALVAHHVPTLVTSNRDF